MVLNLALNKKINFIQNVSKLRRNKSKTFFLHPGSQNKGLGSISYFNSKTGLKSTFKQKNRPKSKNFLCIELKLRKGALSRLACSIGEVPNTSPGAAAGLEFTARGLVGIY